MLVSPGNSIALHSNGAGMSHLKSFIVFGERIDVLIDSAMSNGASAAIVQHVPAGGGPPPHSHAKEDETFTVLEGDFEVFRNGQWHPLAKGEVAYGQRGGVHTFRNIGTAPGQVLIFIAPAGLENYLEEISHYSPPADMPKILEISDKYGITFYM
jgi:quercetin dioxygenase-like cupin family protein